MDRAQIGGLAHGIRKRREWLTSEPSETPEHRCRPFALWLFGHSPYA
jgi:hypothetical protein